MLKPIRHMYFLALSIPNQALSFIGTGNDGSTLIIYDENIKMNLLYSFLLDNNIEINYV